MFVVGEPVIDKEVGVSEVYTFISIEPYLLTFLLVSLKYLIAEPLQISASNQQLVYVVTFRESVILPLLPSVFSCRRLLLAANDER